MMAKTDKMANRQDISMSKSVDYISVCNRKFGINEVYEKLRQRVFLKGSLALSHGRKIFF